jgi:hypothetical protein
MNEHASSHTGENANIYLGETIQGLCVRRAEELLDAFLHTKKVKSAGSIGTITIGEELGDRLLLAKSSLHFGHERLEDGQKLRFMLKEVQVKEFGASVNEEQTILFTALGWVTQRKHVGVNDEAWARGWVQGRLGRVTFPERMASSLTLNACSAKAGLRGRWHLQ